MHGTLSDRERALNMDTVIQNAAAILTISFSSRFIQPEWRVASSQFQLDNL